MQDFKFNRLCDRYNVEYSAKIRYSHALTVPVSISEVSRTGLRLDCGANVPRGPIMLAVKIAADRWIEVCCERVWQSGKEVGLRIFSPCDMWEQNIRSLSVKAA